MFLNLEKYSKRSYEFHIFKKGFEWKEMDGSSLKDKFTMIGSSSTWRGETKQDWAGSKEAGGESNLILKGDCMRAQQGTEPCGPEKLHLHVPRLKKAHNAHPTLSTS